MSRKSENSAAGSAGDGESKVSSFENSPRKAAELEATGPFGDFSRDYSSSFIVKVGDAPFSSDDDDESCELKSEYLHRLKVIREKLASIDIANKSYYNNCFGYPPHYANQSKIIEIIEDANDNAEPIVNKEDIRQSLYYEDAPLDEPVLANITFTQIQNKNISDSAENNSSDNKSKFIDDNYANFVSETMIHLNDDSNQNGFPISNDTQELSEVPEMLKESNMELKSLFSYGSLYNNYESSTELLDLNYNPPKKKPCVRETTPKLILSEDAMPLPYHIRVSLHKDISKAAKQPSKENNLEVPGSVEVACDVNKSKEANNRDDHASAVDVEQLKSNDDFSDDFRLNVVQKSPRKSTGKDNLYVLFLDTLTQSSSESLKSNKTIVTNTTATIESPSRIPKKRRIFLRSARNKVKPIDSLTLWEEIRTMEAVNKRKRLESSSSKETYFESILLDKVAKEEEIHFMSLGSLDIPRKSSLICKKSTRFPSLTKITKFCSSAFEKTSDKFVEDRVATVEVVASGSKENNVQKVANTLLNLKQEQVLSLENDDYTPSGEMHSEFECTNSDEDIDANYQPFCLFCFCF